MLEHDRATVLNKYDVTYYICPHCGFVQTENPYWLDEAYSKAIASEDTGVMRRNLRNANSLLPFLRILGNDIKILDFGGGHGILTRIMRDYGFDFYHQDKYAENLFANGFEGDLNQKWQLITAFENFEHFVEPMEEIERLMGQTDILYFSTELLPDNAPLIKDWWYYAPGTGQHIAFYSRKSLHYIARKLNVHLITNGHSLHIFSKVHITKNYFAVLRIYKTVNHIINIGKYLKKKSKTIEDMNTIIAKNRVQK